MANSTVFQMIKMTAFRAAQSSTFDRFLRLLENADGQQPGFLRVLTYHRIDKPARRPWLDPGLISASPEDFDRQMAYLAAHYQMVSVEDVFSALNSRDTCKLPQRAVLVTFDDGYCDFEEQAWPILRRYKVPATLFIPTAYPDHPERTFWWDDLYHALQNTNRHDKLDTPVGTLPLTDAAARSRAYHRLKEHMKTLKHGEVILRVMEICSELGVQPRPNCIMGWETLRRLSQEGLILGAHTRTHPLLNRISPDEAREELLGSLEDLARETGFALPIFAYPGGKFNDEVTSMLEHEGVSLAFTTKRGINRIASMNPLKIQRINVGGRTSLPVLRAQLLSWTIHFNRLQSHLDG